MIISFASTKGGVGKSTIALVLATYFAKHLPKNGKEFSVACIDSDPNQTLDTALKLVNFPEIWQATADAQTLLPILKEAAEKADLILIDLEGSANQAMLYAAGKSNLVIIPAQPSAFDVREAKKTFAVVRQAADLVGREIQVSVVLSRTPVLKQRVAEHSKNQFVKSDLPMLDVELMQRTIFQQMSYSGVPPFIAEPGGGAAANVEALAKAVAAKIGLTVGQGV